MGKSPGKWIKTVLFGKKSSKSNISKDVSNGRKISSVAKAPSNDLAENPSVVFEPAPQTTYPSSLTEYEVGVTNVPTAEVTLLSGTQGADGQGTTPITSADSNELNRQHQAATKAQAAFRGYLARRAFWALKGIIRLQALVRGHLVRRQAVATLQCMHAIVKFQALVRGRIVRHSVGHEVYNKFGGEPVDKPVDILRANLFLGSMKQSSNPFVRKLLSSSPVAMPLSLQYDLGEPNSAWTWLERWSSSRFWIPLARPKKIIDAKPKRKQVSTHAAEEIEAARPKRSVRKIPATNGDSSKLHSSEHEKPKRNPRKSSSHQQELAQEQPQSELEKVKRSLRKVTSAALVPTDVPEAATEKPQNNQRKAPLSALLPSDVPEAAIEKPQNHQNGTPSSALVLSDVPDAANDKSQNNHKETPGSPSHEASEKVVDHSSEKPSDLSVAVPTQAVAEAPPESLALDEPLDLLCENLTAVELHSLDTTEKVENSPNGNEDQSSKEDKTSKEIQKRRRRKSTPVKQEYPESVSQNSPTLPSYMQATQSAKAKLRAQEAQRFGDDEAENGFTRRHSLPASTNVKLSTPSPRMQKPLQTNGKGGSKSNRSLTSSRDDKSPQAGWRR